MTKRTDPFLLGKEDVQHRLSARGGDPFDLGSVCGTQYRVTVKEMVTLARWSQ